MRSDPCFSCCRPNPFIPFASPCEVGEGIYSLGSFHDSPGPRAWFSVIPLLCSFSRCSHHRSRCDRDIERDAGVQGREASDCENPFPEPPPCSGCLEERRGRGGGQHPQGRPGGSGGWLHTAVHPQRVQEGQWPVQRDTEERGRLRAG